MDCIAFPAVLSISEPRVTPEVEYNLPVAFLVNAEIQIYRACLARMPKP